MAVTDFFLKIDKIPGESKSLPGAIELLSFKWGGTQAGSYGEDSQASKGKCSLRDFEFKMKASNASPKFMKAMCGGGPIGPVVLTARQAGSGDTPQAYLTITMDPAKCSFYETSGGDTDNPNDVIDTVRINFGKIEHECKAFVDGAASGAVKASYDVIADKTS